MPSHYLNQCCVIIPPLKEVEGGYTDFTLSVCPSVDRIMYFLQYLLDLFHIYTSYQATIEGMSCVMLFFLLNNKNFGGILRMQAFQLLTGILATNFSEILIKIQKFSFTKMHLKLSFAKWLPFCPGIDELNNVEIALMRLNVMMSSKVPVQHSYFPFSHPAHWWKCPQ